MVEMQRLFERLRTDPALQDAGYDPPFSDFNPVIDNHGTAVNVTVPKATRADQIPLQRRVDPAPVLAAVHEAAAKHGLEVTETREGPRRNCPPTTRWSRWPPASPARPHGPPRSAPTPPNCRRSRPAWSSGPATSAKRTRPPRR